MQVSSGKVTVKVDASLAPRVEDILGKAGLKPDFVQFDGNSVKARFADLDAQRKAKDALGAALNPDAERSDLHRRPQPALALAASG